MPESGPENSKCNQHETFVVEIATGLKLKSPPFWKTFSSSEEPQLRQGFLSAASVFHYNSLAGFVSCKERDGVGGWSVPGCPTGSALMH